MKLLNRGQRGSTLIIAMIILVAITLLVVFAIRSGNMNLLIAGNSQVQAEANAAVQQAVEQAVEKVIATEDITLIPEQTVSVVMGSKTYEVTVEPMNACITTASVTEEKLDVTKTADKACKADVDRENRYDEYGRPIPYPSECSNQLWEVKAGVNDFITGAKVQHGLGVTVRVPFYVNCPAS